MRAFLTALAAAIALAACAPRDLPPPSHDRVWASELMRLSSVRWQSDERFTLANVRNFSWDANGISGERWETRRYDLSQLRAIWFNVEPFPGVPGLAHSFLSFDFGDGPRAQSLTLSIEARREIGETYSPLAGLEGAYELIFIWTTQKDFLTNAVTHLNREVEAYPVNVTPQEAQTILRGFLARTDEIAATPERYNTFRHNCTSELADVVNRAFGERIPWDPSFILTSRAAGYLHRLGYLGDPDAPLQGAGLAPLVKAYRDLPERRFSVAMRRSLEAWQAATRPD